MGEVLSCLPFLRAASFRCVMVTFDTPMMCLIARVKRTNSALPGGFFMLLCYIMERTMR
jgi:hypothetical protein